MVDLDSTALILRRLDERMAELGLTDNAASKMAGVDRGYLGQLRRAALNDNRSPTVRNLVRLSGALGLRLPYVVDGTGRRLIDEPDPLADMVEVPILSWVAASLFSEVPSIEAPEGVLYLTGLGRGDFIALVVRGDSMDRIAPEGAHIIIDRCDTDLVARDFYVCSTDDHARATFKRFVPDPDRLAPFSTNLEHEPIMLSRPPRVLGRLTRVINDIRRNVSPGRLSWAEQPAPAIRVA